MLLTLIETNTVVIMKIDMINNFLIINCIGKDDRLGLRINKDFFIKNFDNQKMKIIS